MPTLMSETTSLPPSHVPNGITAQPTSARTNVISGAMMKTTLLAPDGITVSLKISFTPSAIGCSSPNQPTTLGPLRSCTAAMILRSA